MHRAVAATTSETSPVERVADAVVCGFAGFGAQAGRTAAKGLDAFGARAFSAIVPRARGLDAPHRSTVSPSAPNPLDRRTDEQLLVAHRAGDPDALRALIDRYRAELHGFLTRLVGSRAGADDVFQEAFLQVHLSADSFDQERRFKPWLYTIAANKGRDFLRRQKRRAAASLDAPTGKDSAGALVDLLQGDATPPSRPLESVDEAAIVKQVVDEMPPHFREILLLSYFQRLSYAQIADSLAIPLGTVKSRLHAAVACFAESWKLTCARRGVAMPGDARDGAPSDAGRDAGARKPRSNSNGDDA